jgi:TonB family protein
MKISVLSVFACAVLFAGCLPSGTLDQSYSLPKLVEYTGLPPLSPAVFDKYREVVADLLILESGSVSIAKLRQSSGDESWDSSAEARLLQWKFIPAKVGDRPVRLWIRQPITLKFEDPEVMFLSAIECDNLGLADSLYMQLVAGIDFGQLAMLYGNPKSRAARGALGQVELHQYPLTVRTALLQLKEGEFSRPLQCGERRIIFRREK